MKNIIYFNGDSWTENFLFKRVYNQELSKDFFIVNSSVGGNWNKNIINSSINDLNYLLEMVEPYNVKINAFIFLSEWFRSYDEIILLKNFTQKIKVPGGINQHIEIMSQNIIDSFINKFAKSDKISLHVSTAFIDCNWTTILPMYLAIQNKITIDKLQEKCYSVSYFNKNNGSEFINMGFSKQEILEFMQSNLDRCKLLQSIAGMKDYHVATSDLYVPVVEQLKQFL